MDHTDLLGQYINIGDIVLFTESETTQMFLAEIVEFTPKKVKLKTFPSGRVRTKDKVRVIRFQEQYDDFRENYPELHI